MSHSKCYKSVSSYYNILAVHDLKMSHGTLCLSPLLPQIFVHIEWVFLTRLFNTWHDFLKMSFRIFSVLHSITVKNYVRNDGRENDRTDELKYRHPSKHLCRHICESVCLFLRLFACGKLDDSTFVTAVALYCFWVALQMDVFQMLQWGCQFTNSNRC